MEDIERKVRKGKEKKAQFVGFVKGDGHSEVRKKRKMCHIYWSVY